MTKSINRKERTMRSKVSSIVTVLVNLVALLAGTQPAYADPGSTGQECIKDAMGWAADANVCTSETVDIGAYTVVSAPDSCTAGEQINVTLALNTELNGAKRYDFGIWVAEDGGDAVSTGGTCFREYLHPLTQVGTEVDTTSGTGPFWDARSTDASPREDADDICGDGRAVDLTFKYNLPQVTTICRDSDGDGYADIGTCLSWDNNTTGTCLGELTALPSTTSMCKCSSVQVGEITVIYTLEVIKELSPEDDSGLFDLLVDSVTKFTDASHQDTTGQMVVASGTHTVSEAAGTGTDLTDYDTAIECVNATTGLPVASCDPCTELSYDTSDPNADAVKCTISNRYLDPTAVALSSFAAKAGDLASPLWLGLAGLTVLAAGTLFWAKRRSR